MMMLQLNPPIPVRVPPDLDALAVMVIDRGQGTHLEWVVHILEGSNVRCCWTFHNPQVRFNTSLSDGWLEMRPFTEEDKKQFSFLEGSEDEDNG